MEISAGRREQPRLDCGEEAKRRFAGGPTGIHLNNSTNFLKGGCIGDYYRGLLRGILGF